jgi:hypothetical protein
VQARDEAGRVFLDYDPQLLGPILGWLRHHSIAGPGVPPLQPAVPPGSELALATLLDYLGLSRYIPCRWGAAGLWGGGGRCTGPVVLLAASQHPHRRPRCRGVLATLPTGRCCSGAPVERRTTRAAAAAAASLRQALHQALHQAAACPPPAQLPGQPGTGPGASGAAGGSAGRGGGAAARRRRRVWRGLQQPRAPGQPRGVGAAGGRLEKAGWRRAGTLPAFSLSQTHKPCARLQMAGPRLPPDAAHGARPPPWQVRSFAASALASQAGGSAVEGGRSNSPMFVGVISRAALAQAEAAEGGGASSSGWRPPAGPTWQRTCYGWWSRQDSSGRVGAPAAAAPAPAPAPVAPAGLQTWGLL